ncbi:MAG: hemerythrin domain-containing protein [Nitrospira sp. CR2.1]|nr:hemerythrin domain-containing protein [Nitrospira sp. CR2.1]MBA5873832.1 hemerythrin domain-containing protein [Nitrospira sp. CR1.2]
MLGKTAFASGVVEMLKDDHENVKHLFEKFESADGRGQGMIADRAIAELEIHAELEEQLIYPAIRRAIEDNDMMNEAVEEHHLVHVLIAELKKLKPKDEKFHAKFCVLSELVKHHIEEEEGEMLPEAERQDIDWEALEVAVMKRREALMSKSSEKGRGESKTTGKSSRRT